MKTFSMRVCFFVFTTFLFWASGTAGAKTAAPRDWPDGYVVKDRSASPDGRIGVIIPSSDTADQNGGEDSENFLANLKTHKVIGKIEKTDYFERQNHRGLNVTWAPDSSACVLVYEGRFGYEMIVLLEIEGSRFTQLDLSEHIEKVLRASAGEEGYSSAWFRFVSGRKIQARALDYTGNPKLMDEKTKQTHFAGTFDRATRKWAKAEAHRTKNYDVLSSAYSVRHGEDILVTPDGDQSKVPPGFTGETVNSDEEKEKTLDEEMNAVYAALRAVLPSGQFAKVKQDQVAWLKKRDAAPASQRSALLIDRTKALEEILWK